MGEDSLTAEPSLARKDNKAGHEALIADTREDANAQIRTMASAAGGGARGRGPSSPQM